jgi:hypothetical protein
MSRSPPWTTLREALNEILDECHEMGMQMPFVVSLVSPDGNVPVLRWHGFDKDPDVLAMHLFGEVPLSVVIMVLDQCSDVKITTVEVDFRRLN